MYLATLRTSNFEFVSLGETVDRAVELIRNQWEYHASDSPDTYAWEIVEDSLNVCPIVLNDVFGDCMKCENLIHGAELH